MPALKDLPLEDGRRGLIRWLQELRPHGSANNKVTIVFDGHPDHYGSAAWGPIGVIFSDGCSADDTIKSMVEETQDRKNCVIVSDDKEIYLYARSLGAKVMKVGAFTSRGVKPQGRGDPDVKNISLTSQEKINRELRSFWLKE
jgi:predicted RNA-binding protein with PIN domain